MAAGNWYRVLCAVWLAIGVQPIWADGAPDKMKPVERDLGTDHYVAGCPISVEHSVAGDLLAAGCELNVLAEVAGDAVVAGGRLRVAAPVQQGVYAAGGNISIDSAVRRNVRVAGGSIELGPNSKIAGNVTAAGGRVEIDGAIGGYLQVGAGRVWINGPVAGDVEVGAGSLELGPKALIEGRLRYASRREIEKDAGAQVRGGIERVETSAGWPRSHSWMEGARRGIHWVWSLGLLICAAILVMALPQLYKDVAETARTRWAFSLLVGFLVLVCVPVATLIAVVSVIGIPLALVLMALYIPVLLVGYVSAGIALGDAGLKLSRPQGASKKGWRLTAALLGILLLSLLGRMPFVGWLVTFAAMLTGIGALLIQLRFVLTGRSALGASS